jgi:hypothetical protein
MNKLIFNTLDSLNHQYGRGRVKDINLSNPLRSGRHVFSRLLQGGKLETRWYYLTITDKTIKVRALKHQITVNINLGVGDEVVAMGKFHGKIVHQWGAVFIVEFYNPFKSPMHNNLEITRGVFAAYYLERF